MRLGSPGPAALALAVAWLAVGAGPARAQVGVGIHAAEAGERFDGARGVGARLDVRLPVVPVWLSASGEHYFPDCGDADCRYRAGGVDAVLDVVPLPLLDLRVSGGLMVVATEEDGVKAEDGGLVLGAGAALGLGRLSLYGDLRREFVGDDQWVVRIGLALGGGRRPAG